ncbi:MAG: putative RDD family membrane protein YckC [Gammaproteobacteria bacterium]|jgi:uncharacterized RDD family membrane protein YckC
MAAVTIDLYIAMFLTHLLQNYILTSIGLTIEDHRPLIVGVLLLYFSLFWWSPLRATPIQFLFGMRVVDGRGAGLNFRQAVVRSVSLVLLIAAAMILFKLPSNPYLILVAIMGYASLFLAAVSPNYQAGHDMLAHSLVVNKTVLNSPERYAQLCEHVSNNDTVSIKKWTPPIIRTLGNALVLGVPVYVLFNFALIGHDRDLQNRTRYALEGIEGLKIAITEHNMINNDWPTNEKDLGVATRADYPDGGFYQLEDHGVIRIRFTVKPELMKGSLVVTPKLEDEFINWECHSESDIANGHLPSLCRN